MNVRVREKFVSICCVPRILRTGTLIAILSKITLSFPGSWFCIFSHSFNIQSGKSNSLVMLFMTSIFMIGQLLLIRTVTRQWLSQRRLCCYDGDVEQGPISRCCVKKWGFRVSPWVRVELSELSGLGGWLSPDILLFFQMVSMTMPRPVNFPEAKHCCLQSVHDHLHS